MQNAQPNDKEILWTSISTV